MDFKILVKNKYNIMGINRLAPGLKNHWKIQRIYYGFCSFVNSAYGHQLACDTPAVSEQSASAKTLFILPSYILLLQTYYLVRDLECFLFFVQPDCCRIVTMLRIMQFRIRNKETFFKKGSFFSSLIINVQQHPLNYVRK